MPRVDPWIMQQDFVVVVVVAVVVVPHLFPMIANILIESIGGASGDTAPILTRGMITMRSPVVSAPGDRWRGNRPRRPSHPPRFRDGSYSLPRRITYLAFLSFFVLPRLLLSVYCATVFIYWKPANRTDVADPGAAFSLIFLFISKRGDRLQFHRRKAGGAISLIGLVRCNRWWTRWWSRWCRRYF